MRSIFLCCAVITGVGLAACRDSKEPPAKVAGSRAPEGLNTPLIEVPGEQVVSGFKHGKLREDLEISGFSISKRPINRRQFDACVSDGACGASPLTCANADGADDHAALCVGLENAKKYCAWSGGRLPQLGEWFLAARGRTPQRFSWGDTAPSCAQHPLAAAPAELEEREAAAGAPNEPQEGKTECGEQTNALLRVGRHEAGASTYGLEDVLLAPAELLIGHESSNFHACRNGEHGCLVYGLTPGGIDSVAPHGDEAFDVAIDGGSAELAAEAERSVSFPYTFRCVWTTEGT